MTNTTFDGYQTWNRGGFGFRWDGAADAAVSIGLAIHNVRWEQPTAPGGYMIYISHGRTLYNLLLSNLNGGSQHPPRPGETAEPIVNGIYLRNVTNVTLQNFFFVGTSIGLKLDQAVVPGSAPRPTVENVTLAGVDFPDPGTKVDLSGGVRMRGAYVRGARPSRSTTVHRPSVDDREQRKDRDRSSPGALRRGRAPLEGACCGVDAVGEALRLKPRE